MVRNRVTDAGGWQSKFVEDGQSRVECSRYAHMYRVVQGDASWLPLSQAGQAGQQSLLLFAHCRRPGQVRPNGLHPSIIPIIIPFMVINK